LKFRFPIFFENYTLRFIYIEAPVHLLFLHRGMAPELPWDVQEYMLH
jgi:hypothetical protein